MSQPSITEIDSILVTLNNEIYEAINHEEIQLSMTSLGWAISISFLGIVLWQSENDERKYLDEENDIREDLENYLRTCISKEINTILKLVNLYPDTK